MKKYLLKSLLFFCICFTILTFIMVKYGGNIDYFYLKFTTPQAKSMIIGDSRSMQGIQPKILNKNLDTNKYNLPVFNYSFTLAQAKIGPLYNNSILRKLDNNVTNGIFIISINPWMLASKNTNDNTLGEFEEANHPPHNMYFVSNFNPNYEYLIKNLNFFHFRGVFRKNSTLHSDGWLQENSLPENKKILDHWKIIQLEKFNKVADNYHHSELRLKSLNNLVVNLKKHGEVYLIRMPIENDMLELENNFNKYFDLQIEDIAMENSIKYINFNKEKNGKSYKTYDGHHIDKYGGVEFTEDLSAIINTFN